MFYSRKSRQKMEDLRKPTSTRSNGSLKEGETKVKRYDADLQWPT
jgi:hypothetical protein